jgi:hypothetical protein
MCPSFKYGCVICAIQKAADVIEELTALSRRQEVDLVELTGELASKPRWIPVTERLPELNVPCLVYNKSQPTMVGWRIDDKRFRIPGSYLPDHPTHWMPLPEPPEEGE